MVTARCPTLSTIITIYYICGKCFKTESATDCLWYWWWRHAAIGKEFPMPTVCNYLILSWVSIYLYWWSLHTFWCRIFSIEFLLEQNVSFPAALGNQSYQADW